MLRSLATRGTALARPIASQFARPVTATASPASSSSPASDFGSLDVSEHRLTRPTKREPAPKRTLKRTLKRTSLVAETLKDMETDEEFKLTARDLKRFGQKKLTLEERKKRRRALDELGVPTFREFLDQHGAQIERVAPTVLQLNIGLYCNQACSHCHVESSPKRMEMMSREVAEQCLAVVRASRLW